MQPEIQGYFQRVAEEYDVVRRVRFGCAVVSARWDEEGAVWSVRVRDESKSDGDGEKREYVRRCKILVSAVGALSVPKKCDIPGTERFQGRFFHSAQWDHGFAWKDKEVVTVGE